VKRGNSQSAFGLKRQSQEKKKTTTTEPSHLPPGRPTCSPPSALSKQKSETSPQGPEIRHGGLPQSEEPGAEQGSPRRGAPRPPRPSRRAPHPHLYPIARIPRPPRTPHSTGGPGRPHRGRAGPGASRRRALQAARPAERSRPLRRGPATAGGGRPPAARPGSARLTCTPPAGRGSRVGRARPGPGPALRRGLSECGARRPGPPSPPSASAPPPLPVRGDPTVPPARDARRGDAGTRADRRAGEESRPAAQRRPPRPTDSKRGRGREARPAGAASTLPGQRDVPRPSPTPFQLPAVLRSPTGVFLGPA
jgi:hypothetical protein